MSEITISLPAPSSTTTTQQKQNKNIDLFVKTKIDLLEQPLISTKDDKLLNMNYPISICADESFHDSSDLDKISAKYDTINIKLDKTGGLTEALKIQKKQKKKEWKIHK